MDTPRENPDVQQEQIPKFRGLYRHVKISVKALDWIIGACIAVILLVVAIEMRDPGFTVRFDSKGGTDVPAQTPNVRRVPGSSGASHPGGLPVRGLVHR